MANGQTHRKHSFYTACALFPVGVVAGAIVFLPLSGIAFGAITGRVVEPDLDHHQLKSESERMVYEVARPLGFLWQVLWYPYALLHPHRGISHSWPIGTLVRFIWFLWLPIGFSGYLVMTASNPDLIVWAATFWGSWFAVHSIHDAIHFLLDGMPPWGNTFDRKMKRRKKWKWSQLF